MGASSPRPQVVKHDNRCPLSIAEHPPPVGISLIGKNEINPVDVIKIVNEMVFSMWIRKRQIFCTGMWLQENSRIEQMPRLIDESHASLQVADAVFTSRCCAEQHHWFAH
jgi:hypothetical protein